MNQLQEIQLKYVHEQVELIELEARRYSDGSVLIRSVGKNHVTVPTPKRYKTLAGAKRRMAKLLPQLKEEYLEMRMNRIIK